MGEEGAGGEGGGHVGNHCGPISCVSGLKEVPPRLDDSGRDRTSDCV